MTEVDVARKRIGLTMKLNDAAPATAQRGRENRFEGGARLGQHHQRTQAPTQSPAQAGNLGQGAMASAFAKLQKKG